MSFYIDKLQWYIVRTAIDKKITGFKIEDHFSYPNSTYSQFQLDLKKEPFNCYKESTQQVIDEMCRKYQEGSFINTQLFVVDLNEKMFKQEQKNQIMFDLRKQVMLKNLKIEEVFFRAIPEIQKFNIVYLTPQEFQQVFLFLEYKISLDRVQKMLQNFFQPDNYQKYSYLEFIDEFKSLEKSNQQFKGKRNFQNLEEILKRVATCIEQRHLKSLGSLLADQDLKSQNLIEKESFFRVMDSLQFGLGEGDIQEMIRVYIKGDKMVDIVRVRDDINAYIIVPDYKIHLKSVLNQVVNERIVDNIDLSPKSSKKKSGLEQEAQTTYMEIIQDILCGLYVRGSDVLTWFTRFSTMVKGSVQTKDFISAVESLDVRIGDSLFKQQYYDHLLQRQEVYLGYKSHVLLIDQLQQILQKDCSFNKDQMQEAILFEIAKQLSNTMTPIQDQIEIFDNMRQGLVYRADFISNILDNYLSLSSVLTINKKLLITQRYAPSEAILQLRYTEFIQDLKRIEYQNSATIRICLTKDEVDRQKEFNRDKERRELEQVDQEQKLYEQQSKPDEPAQSKKNTVCTLRTMSNQANLKVSIPSFQFDDIMLETFKKGVAVESYFKKFSKPYHGMLVLEKGEFSQAISGLNVKWADQYKLSEMFDAIDLAVHGNYQRRLRIEDLGEAVLINALHNIEEYQAQTIESIYQGLKQQNMLGKLRDLFNFFNTRRDNTCTIKEIKGILLDKLGLNGKSINEEQLDLALPRYQSNYDPLRIDFTIFIRDMEYCNQGIKASLIWAIDLAEDILKGISLKGLSNPEQLFSKFIKVSGVILFEEFRRAMDDIQISIYHDDQEFRDFFNHIELQENNGTVQGTQHNDYSRVGLTSLCNTISRLCQKTINQIYSQILEKIYAESKKQNLSVTVYTIFSQIDYAKTGIVHFSDFKFALEDKLHVKHLKLLDMQVLSKRYKPTRTGADDMVEYAKFFNDYEKIEKLGLRAGFDPLKGKPDQSSMGASQIPQQKQIELPPEVKKIYNDMSNYCKKTQIIDSMCDELVRRDPGKLGMLSEQNLQESFKANKMPLNKKQMNFIIYPLPFDQKGNYNYLIMIDMLFGRVQAQKVQQKYGLQGLSTSLNQTGGPQQSQQNISKEQDRINISNLVMSIRFKDIFELKYQTILNIAYQISKGSYLLRESEYIAVFKRSGVVLLSTDLDFLARSFQAFRNVNNNCVNFTQVTQHFNVTDTSSLLLMEIQKEVSNKNIKIEEAVINYKEFMSFDDMMNMIDVQKIVTKQFTQQEHKTLFDQIAERKVEMEKAAFIRYIKNESEQVAQDYMPYIVNEVVYYICNNNVDIFKIVNPQAKKLTVQQFQTLLQQIKFIPTNPKDLPNLMLYFAVDGDSQHISIDKILTQIKKIIPAYGNSYLNKNPQNPNNRQNQNAIPISKQLSMFNNRVKAVLQKINDHLRKSNISSAELLNQMDMNKNGQVEKSEFITYFTKDQPIKSVSLTEIELLYDALDMNKDGILSVNEICLCIEGIQQTRDQRMRGFDLDMEKELLKEIDQLFNFFDKNNDNSITLEELIVAFRSVNQNISINEAKEMMRLADKDNSQTIDRKEFRILMLPKFKEEILNYEQNMDDLRRLFKECDTDHSNYLSKNEMKLALMKLNIELTDVQLDDLMKEMDLDDNQNIDIDEFMAFLSIADQIKFKNPQAKANIIKIRHARKLHAIDFYNCFKNLPQCFLPSFTTERFEKMNLNTPSYGLYPDFDSQTMAYKDLQKLDHISQVTSTKQYINLYQPHIGCEIQIEEFSGVPLPKKEEFDWNKITHREVRAVLYDFRSSEFLSNSFIIQAQWRPEYEGKWLFNANETLNQAKNFMLRSDLMRQENTSRDVHLLIELVYYTLNNDQLQQVTCAWGSISILQLDKSAKIKVSLKGGSPFSEIKIDQSELHQEKKGFTFLKKLAANVDEAQLVLNVKPFAKFQEHTQYYLSMLPSNCLISKKLLSFGASFRMYCLKKLMKYQQQMTAPQGNFVIAQFRKIFDNPDVNFILGDCWEQEVNLKMNTQIDLQVSMRKMEEMMIKLYSIIYSSEFQFEHVYPTRSTPLDSDLFRNREQLIKNALIPGRYKPTIVVDQNQKKKKDKENNQGSANIQQAINQIYSDEYKPFNISEMEINISGINQAESKQDELLKMYQQMGLIF